MGSYREHSNENTEPHADQQPAAPYERPPEYLPPSLVSQGPMLVIDNVMDILSVFSARFYRFLTCGHGALEDFHLFHKGTDFENQLGIYHGEESVLSEYPKHCNKLGLSIHEQGFGDPLDLPLHNSRPRERELEVNRIVVRLGR